VHKVRATYSRFWRASFWTLGSLASVAMIFAIGSATANRIEVVQSTKVQVMPRKFHRLSLSKSLGHVRISEVTVRDGQWVRPGDVVATLDRVDIAENIGQTRQKIVQAMRVQMCLALAQQALDNKTQAANLNPSSSNKQCAALFAAIDALKLRRSQALAQNSVDVTYNDRLVALRRIAALVPDGVVDAEIEQKIAQYVSALKERGRDQHNMQVEEVREQLHNRHIQAAIDDVSAQVSNRLQALLQQLSDLRQTAENPVVVSHQAGRVDVGYSAAANDTLLNLDIPVRGVTEFPTQIVAGRAPKNNILTVAHSLHEPPRPLGEFQTSIIPTEQGFHPRDRENHVVLIRPFEAGLPAISRFQPDPFDEISLTWSHGSLAQIIGDHYATVVALYGWNRSSALTQVFDDRRALQPEAWNNTFMSPVNVDLLPTVFSQDGARQ
jgi:multidrug efflux pump subunit AcrA (membrane-fusion protein)